MMNRRFLLPVAVVTVVLAAVLLRPDPAKNQQPVPGAIQAKATSSRKEEPAPYPRWNPGDPVTDEVMANYAHFKLRPFRVVNASGRYEWTAEDGMKSAVINELAHNPLERHRLMEENTFVMRRQLIYTKKTLSEVSREAAESGNPLRSFTLPGFDGKEMEVIIDSEEHDKEGVSGTFYGRFAGRDDSMVVMTYYEDRESYVAISRQDGINYEYVPRESGEIVLRSIDPFAPRGDNHDCVPQAPFDTRR